MHAKWFAGHGDHDELKGIDRENKVVREVLDHIAQEHSTPASYFDDARKDLDEARNFAAAKNLLTLPKGGNLQVIPTPEFERGIYAVGGFNPAPDAGAAIGRVLLDYADSRRTGRRSAWNRSCANITSTTCGCW